MIAQLVGAISRAFLVVVAIAAPAFLLPSVSVAAQEISLIIGGIAAAFTLFEYASSHPGLIDFRFAPPYNRVRFFTFFAQVVLISFLCRATVNVDDLSGSVWDFASQARAVVAIPLSPVSVTIELIANDASTEDARELIAQAIALSFTVAFGSLAFFAAVLWFFAWPVGRENFNLWINLPTFPPSTGREVERRLFRDGLVNLLIGVALPYVLPVLASRNGGWFDPSVLENHQPLVWGAALWAFLPATLIIRGAALVKVAYLISRSRGR